MRNLGDLYREYFVELDPILFQMGRVRGVEVDNDARRELLHKLTTEVHGYQDEAQQYVPEQLFPVERKKRSPSEASREKRRVVSVTPVTVERDSVKTCSRCGLQHVTAAKHTARKGGKGEVPLNACYKADILQQPGTDTEFDIRLPFNPGSDDQLRAYAELYRHKLGRNWKTKEATLDAKQLQKFIDKYGDKHPLYKLARSIRGVRKAKGYAKAWVPDELGRLYGQFKNVPETLRLSQADHNFMNVSHRGNVPYADELRRLLIAPPGHVIIEADSSSIEAVMTGYYMGSKSYMEMAKKGIHAYWACQTLGLEPTKENIALIKNSTDLKTRILYETKKRTVHGVSYGMGAILLHFSYPEFFPTIKAAQAEIDDFFQFVPDLQAWQLDTQKWAYKHGYLESPWGFRNYYYQVFNYDTGTKLYRPGPDAKAAVAFKPQHSNGMFQRENLKMIASRGWLKYMSAIGHVHDSNGMIIPEEMVEKAASDLIDVMNRPIKQLGNLIVGVQVKVGKNWGEMEPYRSV